MYINFSKDKKMQERTIEGWAYTGNNQCNTSVANNQLREWVLENMDKMSTTEFIRKYNLLQHTINNEYPPYFTTSHSRKRAVTSGYELADDAIFIKGESTTIRIKGNISLSTGDTVFIGGSDKSAGIVADISGVQVDRDVVVARATSDEVPDNRLVQYTRGTAVTRVTVQTRNGKHLSTPVVVIDQHSIDVSPTFAQQLSVGDQVFLASNDRGYHALVRSISESGSLKVIFPEFPAAIKGRSVNAYAVQTSI